MYNNYENLKLSNMERLIRDKPLLASMLSNRSPSWHCVLCNYLYWSWFRVIHVTFQSLVICLTFMLSCLYLIPSASQDLYFWLCLTVFVTNMIFQGNLDNSWQINVIRSFVMYISIHRRHTRVTRGWLHLQYAILSWLVFLNAALLPFLADKKPASVTST